VIKSSFLIASIALLAAGVAAGCSASSTSNAGGNQGSHMYIGQETLGNVLIFNMPVTSMSMPIGTLTGLAFANELYVDKSGRLFVPLGPQGGQQVQVFTPPIKGGNAPAYTLTTIGVFPESVAEDAAGNIYVGIISATSGCCIDIFNGPVSGAATANSEIMANGVPNGLHSPSGMAFDLAGNLYVSSFSSILRYTPPINSASTPSANVMPNNDNIGLALDLTNVYVANATTDGTIDVFPLPLSVSVRSFGITVTSSADHLNGLAIDGSGNLWAIDGSGGVWEIPAPITSASTPTKILTVSGGAYGITFGP
jgi:hypothetical protein